MLEVIVAILKMSSGMMLVWELSTRKLSFDSWYWPSLLVKTALGPNSKKLIDVISVSFLLLIQLNMLYRLEQSKSHAILHFALDWERKCVSESLLENIIIAILYPRTTFINQITCSVGSSVAVVKDFSI